MNIVKIKIHFILLCVLSLNVFSQDYHFYFDVENILAKKIPTSKSTSYKKELLFKTTSGMYRVFPGVKEIINELIKNNVRVSILSPDLIDADLKEYIMSLGVSSSEIFNLDYNSISNQLPEIIKDEIKSLYFTQNSELTLKFPGKVISLGESYYFFESFEHLKTEKLQLEEQGVFESHKDYFAKSEKNWEKHYKKFFEVYGVFQTFKSQTIPAFRKYLQSGMLDSKKLISQGFRASRRSFQSIYHEWVIDKATTVVKGCNKVDISKKEEIFIGNISTCLNELDSQEVLKTLSGRITGCEIQTLDGARVKNLSINDCISQDKLKFAWLSESKKQCASVYENKLFSDKEDKKKCNKSFLVLEDDKYFLTGDINELLKKLTKKQFSLSKYSPAKQVIDGVEFPRTFTALYRGCEPKLFTLKKALQSMFGGANNYVESLLFSGIKYKLMGIYELDSSAWVRGRTVNEWWREVLPGVLLIDFINDLIKENGVYFSEKVAIDITKLLMENSYFTQLETIGKSEILDRVANYQSAKYNDFPRDVVFGSAYPRVSARYGAAVLVYQNRKEVPRILDLTFWNKVYNGVWAGGGDAGEYIAPSYIAPEELIGYEIHKRGDYPDKTIGRVSFPEYSVQVNEYLDVLFHKFVKNGETYVAVVDGTKRDGSKGFCIRYDESSKLFKHCESIKSPSSKDPKSKFTETAGIIGVIKLCPLSGKCDLSKDVLDSFPLHSNEELPVYKKDGLNHGNILNQISSVKVNNKKIKLFRKKK